MGPVTVIEEVGLDVGVHVGVSMQDAFGERSGFSDHVLILSNLLLDKGFRGKKVLSQTFIRIEFMDKIESYGHLITLLRCNRSCCRYDVGLTSISTLILSPRHDVKCCCSCIFALMH